MQPYEPSNFYCKITLSVHACYDIHYSTAQAVKIEPQYFLASHATNVLVDK